MYKEHALTHVVTPIPANNMSSTASNTPFADPLWLNRTYSPYYTASHRRLQREVREYVDTHIAPFCEEWEQQGSVPAEVSKPLFDIYLPDRILTCTSPRPKPATPSSDTPPSRPFLLQKTISMASGSQGILIHVNGTGSTT
jgi:hypothetical protein